MLFDNEDIVDWVEGHSSAIMIRAGTPLLLAYRHEAMGLLWDPMAFRVNKILLYLHYNSKPSVVDSLIDFCVFTRNREC